MHGYPTFQLVFYSLFLLVLLVIVFFSARYHLRRAFSFTWTQTATIERDDIRFLKYGSCGVFRYNFRVNGTSYGGRFFIVDNREHAEIMQQKLDVRQILIKYRPRDPTVSLLSETWDPRYEGLLASQDPFLLIDPWHPTSPSC